MIGHAFRRSEGSLTPPLEVAGQPLPNVRVDLPSRHTRITQRKVVPPALQVSIELLDQQRNRFPGLSQPCQLTQLLPLPCQGFLRRNHVQVAMLPTSQVAVVPKRISQKVQGTAHLPQVYFARLVPVDLQTQPGFPFAFDEPPQPSALPPR